MNSRRPDDNRVLGKAIQRIRLIRGMTRSDLAAAAGLPKEMVSLIEQGKQRTPEATIKTIASALRLPRGCLSILARERGKTKAMTEFVQSLQKLIAALVEAQEKGVAITNGATRQRERRKAV
ncbi:MAG: helix-turn-helix domain-containing protein [Pirellulales bacterium]